MSTYTIDDAAQQRAGGLMNGALLRVASVAAMSIVFALIHCAAPLDDGLSIARPASDMTAQAHAAAPVHSLDHGIGAEAHAAGN